MTINPFAEHMSSPAPTPASKIGIDAAVLSGFRLIRREPLAVLAWGLVYVLFNLACFALFAPVYLNAFANARAMAGAAAAGPSALTADALRIQGLGMLLGVVGMIMRAIQTCAVSRAVLRPGDRRFGYLRLGTAELCLALIYLGLYFATLIAVLVLVMAFSLLTAALYLAHALQVAVVLDLLAFVAAVSAAIYVSLRLSLIAPLVVEDEKPHFARSWIITRGHAGALLAVALCLFGILIAMEVLLVGVLLFVAAAHLSTLSQGAEGSARVTAFFARSPAAILSAILPYVAGLSVIAVPLAGAAWAIIAAPWARAYVDLRRASPAL